MEEAGEAPDDGHVREPCALLVVGQVDPGGQRYHVRRQQVRPQRGVVYAAPKRHGDAEVHLAVAHEVHLSRGVGFRTRCGQTEGAGHLLDGGVQEKTLLDRLRGIVGVGEDDGLYHLLRFGLARTGDAARDLPLLPADLLEDDRAVGGLQRSYRKWEAAAVEYPQARVAQGVVPRDRYGPVRLLQRDGVRLPLPPVEHVPCSKRLPADFGLRPDLHGERGRRAYAELGAVAPDRPRLYEEPLCVLGRGRRHDGGRRRDGRQDDRDRQREAQEPEGQPGPKPAFLVSLGLRSAFHHRGLKQPGDLAAVPLRSEGEPEQVEDHRREGAPAWADYYRGQPQDGEGDGGGDSPVALRQERGALPHAVGQTEDGHRRYDLRERQPQQHPVLGL